MAYFANVVRTCDGVAFMRFPNKKIGAGVAKEIQTALDAGKPVCEIVRGKLQHVAEMPSGVMSVDQTRAEIKRIIASRAKKPIRFKKFIKS